MSALLPCECGRIPFVLRRRPWKGGQFNVEAVWVECTPCGARGSTYAAADEPAAIAAWNRRAPTDARRAAEEMRERAAKIAMTFPIDEDQHVVSAHARVMQGLAIAAAIRALPLPEEEG